MNEPKTRMKHFVDKSHAVGHIWCLEHHFGQISKILDDAGVPQTENRSVALEILAGKPTPLTVQQRVQILAAARQALLNNMTEAQKAKALAEFQSFVPTPEEDDIDPEDINEIIWSEGDFGVEANR